jgi:transcriptional regulator with XRE-family HTH domain
MLARLKRLLSRLRAAHRQLPKRGIDHHAGRRLAEVRRHRQLTQQQLAAAIRVTARTVKNWERGRNLLTSHRIAQIALALQCRRSDLLAAPGAPLPRRLRLADLGGTDADDDA